MENWDILRLMEVFVNQSSVIVKMSSFHVLFCVCLSFRDLFIFLVWIIHFFSIFVLSVLGTFLSYMVSIV